jgi:hypothetical protein
MMLAAVPLAFLAVAAWLAVRAYRNEQRLLDAELLALPPFAEAEAQTEAARQAAEALACRLPPTPPTLSVDAVQRQVSHDLQAAVREQFSPRAFSEQVLAINRHYTPAKPGARVTFQIALENRTVSGEFKGIESGGHWVFVLVDQQRYRMGDIAEEYHHLFNEGIAHNLAEAVIAALRTGFESRRSAFVIERRRQLEERHFQAAGYRLADGEWRPVTELHAERATRLLAERKQAFAREREEEIRGIIERHRLLGFYPVTPTVEMRSAVPAAEGQGRRPNRESGPRAGPPAHAGHDPIPLAQPPTPMRSAHAAG